jgi:hypothetical protein
MYEAFADFAPPLGLQVRHVSFVYCALHMQGRQNSTLADPTPQCFTLDQLARTISGKGPDPSALCPFQPGVISGFLGAKMQVSKTGRRR